jgi:uncharacterized protein YjbI with pentapeptide repeats
MKTKIQIKSVWGGILFEYESENNSVKETIIEALKSGANLRRADLSGAVLSDAVLSGAVLSDAVLRRADLSGAVLRRANLSGANLSDANLSGAYLRRADLSDANLSDADLSGADLSGADLSDANLSGAVLSDAVLSGAVLSDAVLRRADLRRADLRRADLSGAVLSGADLSDAYLSENTAFLLSQCPSEGSFIAWKKANGYIVKLRITENAKRSSATTLKCRCSEAEVLGIENIDGTKSALTQVCSDNDSNFIYEVGKIVKVEDFDENRWNECSSGIHFFIAREMAVRYN